MTYLFLQQYWWLVVSLLGALLVFLLFVQGANSMIFSLGYDADTRRLLVNSTGRKWEITFTTLVTFGGAYWLWMIILFTFVMQAVSYEFQNKLGNFLGVKTFQICLVINGILGPLLLGGAVATFFDGSNFVVEKANITNVAAPVISRWANASNGLDALLNVWNVIFGLAVLFLARVLGTLYVINNVNNENIRSRGSVQLVGNAALFLVCFLTFFIHVLLKAGYAYDPATGVITMEPLKYLHNFIEMWYLSALLIVGVVLVLYGIVRTIVSKTYIKGIWPTGIGVILVVLSLLLCAGWNHTAYYPSNVDLQSSLTIENSSSSPFTLQVMIFVSLLVPFVVAYIWYAWRAIDRKKIDLDEVNHGDAY